MLFRVFFIALVALTILDYQPASASRRLIGGLMFFAGFGFALHWTGYLGWRDAFGAATGLKTAGPFGWSRNPIYMVSIVGMTGWGVAANSAYLSILLAIWALLYTAAPFLEEPWLERQYGDEFRNYKGRVSRYFGRIRRSD